MALPLRFPIALLALAALGACASPSSAPGEAASVAAPAAAGDKPWKGKPKGGDRPWAAKDARGKPATPRAPYKAKGPR